MSKFTAILAITGLVSSLSAYPAIPTGTNSFQIVVPNLKGGFDFTIEGLYLQPTNADLDYVTLGTPVGNTISNTKYVVNPNYNLGFRLGTGYIFPNSGNDVQAAWTYFDHTTTDSATFRNGLETVRNGSQPFPISAGDVRNDSSSVNFRYDAIDLDIGQYLSFGTRLESRLFAGLRFAQLENNLVDTYGGTATFDPSIGPVPDLFVENYNSKFTGVGPRVGVDTTYHLGHCLGLVANISGTLLIGRTQSSYSDFENQNGVLTTVDSGIANNTTRIIPGLDARLGLDYSIPFKNLSILTVEAGYQTTQYLDVVDRLNFSQATGVVTRSLSSIGFNGPYLGMNFKL